MTDGTGAGKGQAARGERTRQALLDAAERAFATHGYHGASIRDLAVDAGVRLGVVHYHFRSKEELFRAAVLRKQAAINALIEGSYVAADAAAAPHPLTVEQTIRAFLQPLLTACVAPHDPLQAYVRMTSHMMSSYRLPEVRDTLRLHGELTLPLVTRLRALLPQLDDADFHAGLYALEAAIIFIEQDPGFLDDMSQGHHRADRMDRLIAPFSRLFAAGLEALARD